MAESSYVKLYRNLMGCGTGQALQHRMLRTLAEEPNLTFDWKYSTFNQEMVPHPKLHLPNCNKPVEVPMTKTNGYWLSTYGMRLGTLITLITFDELNALVQENFKKVPTYNCSMELALKWEKKGKKASRDPGKNFAEWFFDICRTQYENRIRFFEGRVAEITKSYCNSAEGTKDSNRAYELHVIDQIRSVVLPWYKKVPASVIKEALDDIIIHAIMEE